MATRYKKRPMEFKNCKNCHTEFQCYHQRKIYCSETCRVRAFQKRHENDDPTETICGPEAQLDFSFKNVGVVAAGTVAGNFLTKALTSDSIPSKEFNNLISQLEKELLRLRYNQEDMMDYLRSFVQVEYSNGENYFNLKTKAQQFLDAIGERTQNRRKERVEALIAQKQQELTRKR